jgi:hypothetical protein
MKIGLRRELSRTPALNRRYCHIVNDRVPEGCDEPSVHGGLFWLLVEESLRCMLTPGQRNL